MVGIIRKKLIEWRFLIEASQVMNKEKGERKAVC
jgi:hypothetical protein